jgi:DNA primase
VFGYIARHYPALDGDRPTKGAKAYWKQVIAGDPGLLFPNMEVMAQVVKEKRVLVVEDYPSMLRINSQMGIPTCCLGGTNIYAKHIDTMLTLGVDELIIVLDADAVVKAVKLKRGLSLAFDSVTVIPLTGADPKDMTHDELNLILKGTKL